MNPIPNGRDAAQTYRRGLLAVIPIVFSVHFLAACEDSNWARSNLNTTAWGQTSEEYRAMALGSYAQARRMLDLAVDDEKWTAIPGQKLTDEDGKRLPPAIILDIDETTLDNLQYAAWLVQNNKAYTLPTWNKWVSEMKAPAIPGALGFIRYARDKGVKVFFVTNRDFTGPIDPDPAGKQLKEFTVQNLKDAGILPVNGTGRDSCVHPKKHLDHDDSVLMRGERDGWGSDKTSRRQLVANCYRVVLLLGDVLGDFIGYKKGGKHLDFYKSMDTGLNRDERRKALRPYEQNWGTRWILLPNPGYGSWERSLYDFQDKLPPREKNQHKLGAVSAWSGNKPQHLQCHVVYDAGTTETRVYVYYKKGGEWVEEKGPTTEKRLAGGVTDDTIVDAVVNLLDDFESFNWKDECRDVVSIQMLATAGMRQEEKKDSAAVATLWEKLHTGLHKKYGQYVDWSDITTKTITGYEEGIYAWLSVKKAREQLKVTGTDFGVVEMGGGSTQVTFPCGKNCANSRNLVIDNKTVPFSIYSFLGLGTDRLPESIDIIGVPAECKYGFGPKFDAKSCSDPIKDDLIKAGAIKDPHLNTFVATPNGSHLAKWYLAGSFFYMDEQLRKGRESDVSNCCVNQLGKFEGCYDLEKSCFVTMYRPIFLEALGINYTDTPKVEPIKSSWTLGALICDKTDCLQKVSPRTCPWRAASKCLEPPAKPNAVP